MTPETARSLLALSQRRTQALRQARELRKELVRIGWSHSAAGELVAIHINKETK
jgi:hypothetical protein